MGLAIPFLFQSLGFAQQSVLRGRVLDPTGAVVPGAQVLASPDGPRPALSTVTNERGEFALAVDDAPYTVTVVAEGFEPFIRRFTDLTTGLAWQDFSLLVAGVRDTVSVTAPRGYAVSATSSATKTLTPLGDVPQSITIVTDALMKDQLMLSVADVVRYVPGITAHQGENNRDQIVVRGNNSSADFFVNGVRDDVQYYRDLYNLDRIEALKGPNAMIFGRGGAGGVVNRVTKEAGFQPVHTVSLQGGAYGHKRFTTDLGEPLNDHVSFRMNGMLEDSDSFRSGVSLERYGVSPTVTIAPGPGTKIKVGYEYLHDARVADRGMTSFQGRPVDLDIATYYGDPANSHVRAAVNLASASLEHRMGRLTIRNNTLVGDYDRFYQNFVPGAVTANQTEVLLSSYNNATVRRNMFNQTDATWLTSTGHLRHTLLGGAEIGRQLTNNFRNTGFFDNALTTISVPFATPTTSAAVTFRQSATDADNRLRTHVAAAYAQDQIEISPSVQVVAGARVDRFDLTYHNNRNGDTLQRLDMLVSPRGGVVFKPATPVSVYGSYGVTYLPSSGDQFSSLTTVTQQVKPERFNNYEAGMKWDVVSSLSLTSAVYRLNRTNTRSTDPNEPTRIVQTGSQRTNGYELGLNGRVTPKWQVAGGYAYQDAYVTSATTAARAGARVAQVPRHTLSLWNNYQVLPKVGAALGLVSRSDMFAAIDDTVTLPGYVRADAAVYYSVKKDLRVQANVENLFNTRYFTNADNNTNISPGTPRALRVALTATF